MANVSYKKPPALMLKVGNPIIEFLLGRGWGPTSELMVLRWRGKKSGAEYSTPVSRFEIDDRLMTFTNSGWRHNFVGGHPVDVTLDKQVIAMKGTVVDDPSTVGAAQSRVIEEWGDKAKRAMALRWETTPTLDEMVEFATANGTVMVEFERTG